MSSCEPQQGTKFGVWPELRTACIDGDLARVQRLCYASQPSSQAETMMELAGLAIDANKPEILDFSLRHGAAADYVLGVRAGAAGFVQIYRILVSHGLSVNQDFDYRGDALCMAIIRNNIELMTYLLDSSAEVHSSRMYNYFLPPIALAAILGTPESVRLLLSRGAPVHETLALHYAAFRGQVEHMHILVDAGADVNENPGPDNDVTFASGDQLGTPLHFAAQGRRMEAVRFLLAQNADSTIRDAAGRSVIERSRKGNDNEVWQDLVVALDCWKV